MSGVICATTERAFVPAIHDIENERRMNLDRRLKTIWWLPRTETDTGHKLAFIPGGMQRNAPSITSNCVPRVCHARDLDLEPFERRINIADGRACEAFLPEYVPGFQG